MQNCIRIDLIDDREFSQCLKIIMDELRLDEHAFHVREHRLNSAVICFHRADHAKLFSLRYALASGAGEERAI